MTHGLPLMPAQARPTPSIGTRSSHWPSSAVMPGSAHLPAAAASRLASRKPGAATSVVSNTVSARLGTM